MENVKQKELTEQTPENIKKKTIQRVSELLVSHGGYGITCEFCVNQPCDQQVSGLVCLHGVEAFLNNGMNDMEIDRNRKCRVCGCTWDNACVGGCYWVEEDLCSQCAEKMNGGVSNDTIF